MSTQTKKSPGSTHKLHRIATRLKTPLALIILLTIFMAPQRSASTQGPPQTPPGQEKPMKTVMINGYEAVANEAIVVFDETDEPQLKAFVNNAIGLVNASAHSEIFPGLNMYHVRSDNMGT